MEITKREILVSVAIVCVMLSIGFLIGEHIQIALNNKYQEYNTAAKIDNDSELFGYAMRTNIGNAFVSGDLTAVDPVSIKDIDGEYAYIYKREDHYVQHTRTVTTTDSKGHTHTHIEHYWTWDFYTDWSWHCNKLRFLGYEFNYDEIPLPDSEYYDTIKVSHRVRYVYYVCYSKYTGTLYTNIVNHTINDSHFYKDVNIESLIKCFESGWEKILFWVMWILFTCGIVFGFYYLENRWLE